MPQRHIAEVKASGLARVAAGGRVIDVFGGAFDPITNGHIAGAVRARRATGADETWLMPNGTQPWKGNHHAGALDRWAMVQAAAGRYRSFRAVGYEIFAPALRTEYELNRAFRDAHPGCRFVWVYGADSALGIPGWKDGPAFMASAHFAVLNRRGYPPVSVDDLARAGFDPDRVLVVPGIPPSISSTAVRRDVALGKSVSGLVPAPVARQIRAAHLYEPDSPNHRATHRSTDGLGLS